MAATGTSAAHCPSSNARLGSGIARVRDMRDAGIAVGLGVDGAASNEYCALWEELRHAVLFARARGGPQALTVRDAVDLATMGGARVLGRQDEIGSLEVGKLADVAVWRLDTLAHIDFADPVAALVLGGQPPLELLLVNGNPVIERSQLLTSTRSPWPRRSTRPARPYSPVPRGPGDAAPAVLPSLTTAAHPPVRTIGVRALPLTPGTPGLSDEDLEAIDRRLAADDAAREQTYPGMATARQPVHTVYVPADQFHVEVAEEWGAAASAALTRYSPRPEDMARITGLDLDALRAVWPAVREKLRREPIEDLRVDLEDGYGTRPDEEEDKHAAMVGLELAAAVSTGSAPPFLGIRCKSLEPADPAARAAHPGPGDADHAGRRRAARRLGVHAAQGHLARPGRRHGRHLRPAGAHVRAGRGSAEVRDPGGDAAGRAAGRRHGGRRRHGARRGRAAAPGCTSAPTTTPPGWASPAATRASTIRRPTTPRR